jgi:hypothetical protein
MSELREAVNMVVELNGKGAALMELRVQRIIAQSESEALQEHVAKLEPYDPERAGIGYILKGVNDHNNSWDCRNLEFFAPGIHSERKGDHRSLRAARRWQQQQEHLGANHE